MRMERFQKPAHTPSHPTQYEVAAPYRPRGGTSGHLGIGPTVTREGYFTRNRSFGQAICEFPDIANGFLEEAASFLHSTVALDKFPR
ncbi:hypothetical protein JTE90_014920 [Oedothorax gibbosus]|uniref:Uncharacterized protein n=1 Tax=Oedothorax gibbosus TaxID=931172 RepID=A0AAV6VMV4_9ARAC|nr:hypothetical protein JTE90_014920 [Oedothorax gibbosus]